MTGLTIAEYPDVMAYHIGDELITDGIRVEAEYENGTTADVTADCTFDYDFSKKGNAQVEVGYKGKTTSFEPIVIRDSANFRMIDPSIYEEDVGYYFKEGASLFECYLWGEDFIVDIEDTNDRGEPYFLDLKLKEKQIAGYDSSPGEKTLTAQIPVGTQNIEISFPALVLTEEDFETFFKVRNDIHLYEHGVSDMNYPDIVPVEVYDFNGAVTADNLVGLLYYTEMVSGDCPFPEYPNSCVPASLVKSWIGNDFIITDFDIEGSSLYDAQNDTVTWDGWGGGYGGCGLPWFRVDWKKNSDGNWMAEYRVKNTSATHNHNAQIVYTSDGQIVSVTMMPEQLELVSAPLKTAYEQGENRNGQRKLQSPPRKAALGTDCLIFPTPPFPLHLAFPATLAAFGTAVLCLTPLAWLHRLFPYLIKQHSSVVRNKIIAGRAYP